MSTDTAVREFVELAFKEVGIKIGWKGRGVHEKGYDKKSRKIIIQIDPCYFRPEEVDFLLGDPAKAKSNLGWKRKMSFEELVKNMVEADLKENEGELYLKTVVLRLKTGMNRFLTVATTVVYIFQWKINISRRISKYQ